jgi:hypothetical protein
MTYHFAKQPNGNIAVYDDTVYNFTKYNLSESDALKICINDLNLDNKDSVNKVLDATDSRWEKYCGIILLKYGQEELNKVLENINE